MKDSGIRKDALVKHLKDQIKSSTEAHNKIEEIVTKSKLTWMFANTLWCNVMKELQHEKMELQAQVQYWKLAAQETLDKGIWCYVPRTRYCVTHLFF